MLSDKRMVGRPVAEHGKQRRRTVNGTRTIERTFNNVFGFKEDRWNGEKPHTQIETPLKFRPAVHLSLSFAGFCKRRISCLMANKNRFITYSLRGLKRSSFGLEVITRKHNQNNKRTERYDWVSLLCSPWLKGHVGQS